MMPLIIPAQIVADSGLTSEIILSHDRPLLCAWNYQPPCRVRTEEREPQARYAESCSPSCYIGATVEERREVVPRELELLLAASRNREVTAAEQEEQRRSFAFGNTHFENERITRDTIDRAAEALKAADAQDGHPEE
jgi:hypothetical protein